MKAKSILIGFSMVFALGSFAYADEVIADTQVPTDAILGKNRIETSLKISKSTYNYCDSVILVNGNNYPDSISAIPLSSNVDAPILLTSGRKLEKEVLDEMKRLHAKDVYIVGGTTSVSSDIESELSGNSLDVERISGKNRYDTNKKIINRCFDGKTKQSVFVSGDNFADAISIGAYVYKNRIPIILLPKNDDSSLGEILSSKNIEKSIIIGGKSSVPAKYDSILPEAKRYSGVSRYETSYIVNREFFKDNDSVVLTSGENFADALSGVPFANKMNANLMLYNQNPQLYPHKKKYKNIHILGGYLEDRLKKNIMENSLFNRNYLQVAENIINDRIPKDEEGSKYFKYRGDFTDFSDELRGDQRILYGFFFLNDLTNSFKNTENKKYIDYGMNLIREFEKEAHSSDKTDMMWHDETTARRLKHYLYFYVNAQQSLSNSDRILIKNSMKEMAYKIAYTDFWSGNNNHGMFQDIAAMNYAYYINDLNMYSKCAKRISQYFASCYDYQGVHLENSPEYHFVILQEFKHFLDNVDPRSIDNYNELKEIYSKSQKFSRAILLPDNTLPNIGDSKKMDIDILDYYSKDNYSPYGDFLEKDTFENSGYDIVKNDHSYLLLRAGFLKKYHHHDDDLSIWLYKDGNIITEAGAFGYEYSNPYSSYVKSFKAHNSLIVDGKNTIVNKEVYLQPTYNANSMKATTERIKGVKFTRGITYNDEFSKISIEDNIVSTDGNEHKYELYLHFDPSVHVSIEGDEVALYKNDVPIGRIRSSANINLTNDVYFSTYYADPKTADVLVLSTYGKNKNINTNIELY